MGVEILKHRNGDTWFCTLAIDIVSLDDRRVEQLVNQPSGLITVIDRQSDGQRRPRGDGALLLVETGGS